jgi:hypothetical protein
MKYTVDAPVSGENKGLQTNKKVAAAAPDDGTIFRSFLCFA